MGTHVIEGKSVITNKRPQIIDRIKRRFRNDGIRGICEALYLRVTREGDEHMKEWTYDELLDLFLKSGFHIEKIHWQKAPNDHCVYISGIKE